MPRSLHILIGLTAAVLFGPGCAGSAVTPRRLDIATTTSVVNSGLLDRLIPAFLADSGITVRAHAAGSGRALEMMQDRVVDLVISHAPEAEALMLAAHPSWQYRKLATNRFLIVGPAEDPAAVKAAANAAAAFTSIARSGAPFISRGDGSGTHEREAELWKSAGLSPAAGRLLTSGGGMATTLRQAHERGAYTLTDEATFYQLREQLLLKEHFAGDPALINSYAVIVERNVPEAALFGAWLTEGKGRMAIGNYQAGQHRPFQLWPLGCPGENPRAILCAN
jgi:tungstate transport system substrate-binding protein